MRRRLLAVLAAVAASLGTALVAVPPAQSVDPPAWTICTGSAVNCIESATANGLPTTPGTAGDGTAGRDFPWVKQIDADLIDFGVWKDLDGYGFNTDSDVDPSVTYRLVLRIGSSFVPREMSGIIRNADYSIQRTTLGWKATVVFEPTGVHHYGIGPAGCSVDGGCVSDTTKATFDVAGFASGSIQTLDTSGLPADEISQRTGMFHATNAQDSYDFYDIDTNSLVVRLANPHLKADGTPVTDGSYETFLPDAWLIGTLGVPDPGSLTGGSFVVTKTVGGTTTPAPFTFTHEPTGIRIKITGISFSKPTYKIHPGPSAPRRVSAHKVSTHKARVSFRKPANNLGYKVNRYQARCHKLGKAWHSAKGTGSPITVGNLPRGKVYCQVRAHNKLGWGVWSVVKHT